MTDISMNVGISAVGTDHIVTMEFIPWEKMAIKNETTPQLQNTGIV